MESTPRINLNKYQYAQLINEVDGLCPICGKKLVYSHGSQAAHIYPHSPSAEERKILNALPILNSNPNTIDNLIMLCPNCHTDFDHPRSAEKYLTLYKLKKQIIDRSLAKEHYEKHNIENDIQAILESISHVDIMTNEQRLSYKVIIVEEKMGFDVNIGLKNIVKRNVRDYYLLIKSCLKELEHYNSGISNLIASEVKTFYLQLKKAQCSTESIYYAIIDWMDLKTQRKYELATPIVTAFYIQNCEVFSND